MKNYRTTSFLNFLILILFGIPQLPLFYISYNHYVTTNKEIDFLRKESEGANTVLHLYSLLENEGLNSDRNISILKQISKIGDESNLILDGALDSYYLMNVVIVEIPRKVRQWSEQKNTSPTLNDWKELSNSIESSLQKSSHFHRTTENSKLNVDHFNEFESLLASSGTSAPSTALLPVLYKASQKTTIQLNELIDHRIFALVNKRNNVLIFTVFLSIISIAFSYLILRTLEKGRRKYEAQINHQKDLIEKGLRLATAGEVFASIGHDISSPLAVIGASSELMGKLATDNSNVESERLLPLILKIKKMTMQSKSIIRNMRSILSDSNETFSTETSLKAIAGDLTELVQPRLKMYQVELEVRVPEIDVPLSVNVAAVLQILTNLVNNAADAMVDSHIKIVTIEASTADHVAIFVVSDSGPGISAENSERIFESLFTTKHNSGGTGLGLTISRRLANSMNGQLKLLPSNSGAKFELKIPF